MAEVTETMIQELRDLGILVTGNLVHITPTIPKFLNSQFLNERIADT